MSEYKKLIVGFGLREEETASWDGGLLYQESVLELARTACDNGADEIFVYDWSQTDEDHERVIGRIREIAREVDAPIIAGGRVKRLEDVKKYLYAGASAVFLDVSVDGNVEMMKEASDRFGGEKICAYLPDMGRLANVKEYLALGASLLAVRTDEETPGEQELAALESCGGDCLVFAGASKAEEMFSETLSDKLAVAFSGERICGAILTLPKQQMECAMDLKQRLKRAGIAVDTFESSLAWEEFKLNGDGLIPVIVQDFKGGEVLMLAYMNKEAFELTLATGRMTYYSRSRQSLWVKGETSGHFQYVKSLAIDCDRDTILATVKQVGAACHTGNHSCFYTTLAKKEYHQTNPLKVFEDVYNVILDRKRHPKEGSYTNYLFDKGIDKILKKVGEEATEIVIAAKNPDPEEVKYEISDFLYHMMVLMAEKEIGWEEITQELANR